MRADRILTILLLLQNKGKLTSRQLADKLEVSERTVMRDMEALSMSGVPVYAERGSQGGWLLADGYRTNLTGMKAEEFIALIVSAHPGLLTDLGIKNHFDTAFQKLLASSPVTLRENTTHIWNKIHIDGAGWHQANESCPHLPIVQEAVWSDRKLCIHYQRDQNTVERTVNPIGLVAKRSVWYLVGEIEGEFRTYRISRIIHAEMLHEPFPRPEDFDLAQYWSDSTEQFMQQLPRYPVKLRMSDHVLARFEQERFVRIAEIGTAEDGWIEVSIEFANLEHGCEKILSFGSSIEVIAPAELRDEVISKAKGIINLYIGSVTTTDASSRTTSE